MGISGTTGVAAIAVDIVKDTPSDAANRGLRALDLNTYADIVRVRQEIEDRKAKLAENPPAEVGQRLGLEIHDRELLLRTYEDIIKPFVSEGWWKDVTTDLNGRCTGYRRSFGRGPSVWSS